ncbi:MAG: ParA family protein [Bdellovibrionales bacterium]|nr:ParA family protein [Bdellovibrionales bacterium]
MKAVELFRVLLSEKKGGGMFYSRSQVIKLFSFDKETALSPANLVCLEKNKSIPKATRNDVDERRVRGWSTQNVPLIGQHLGFLRKPSTALVYSFFVTKGGVLKSSLALNFARMAALHGLRTCVVGLDMQCDITTSLGHMEEVEANDLEAALRWMESTRGLYDIFVGKAEVQTVILPTDIPTLFYIPETPELVSLEQSLLHRPRREQWLQETVIQPLKREFDLVVLDCSPNWNQLITNALVASDVLISPLECKINNFRNLKMFRVFISQIQRDLLLNFRQFYVPTRLNFSRRLSRDIFEWYLKNIPDCLNFAIREHGQGEEATAMHLSVPEYQPGSNASLEMNQLIKSIWLPNLPADKASLILTKSTNTVHQRTPESFL